MGDYHDEKHLRDVGLGDVLYKRDVNEHHGSGRTREDLETWVPPTVTINKVGPKRVGFMNAGRRQAYADRGTRRVDDFTWLETIEQFEIARGRAVMIRQLAEAGIEIRDSRVGTDLLARLTLALEADQEKEGT